MYRVTEAKTITANHKGEQLVIGNQQLKDFGQHPDDDISFGFMQPKLGHHSVCVTDQKEKYTGNDREQGTGRECRY